MLQDGGVLTGLSRPLLLNPCATVRLFCAPVLGAAGL